MEQKIKQDYLPYCLGNESRKVGTDDAMRICLAEPEIYCSKKQVTEDPGHRDLCLYRSREQLLPVEDITSLF